MRAFTWVKNAVSGVRRREQGEGSRGQGAGAREQGPGAREQGIAMKGGIRSCCATVGTHANLLGQKYMFGAIGSIPLLPAPGEKKV